MMTRKTLALAVASALLMSSAAFAEIDLDSSSINMLDEDTTNTSQAINNIGLPEAAAAAANASASGIEKALLAAANDDDNNNDDDATGEVDAAAEHGAAISTLVAELHDAGEVTGADFGEAISNAASVGRSSAEHANEVASEGNATAATAADNAVIGSEIAADAANHAVDGSTIAANASGSMRP